MSALLMRAHRTGRTCSSGRASIRSRSQWPKQGRRIEPRQLAAREPWSRRGCDFLNTGSYNESRPRAFSASAGEPDLLSADFPLCHRGLLCRRVDAPLRPSGGCDARFSLAFFLKVGGSKEADNLMPIWVGASRMDLPRPIMGQTEAKMRRNPCPIPLNTAFGNLRLPLI